MYPFAKLAKVPCAPRAGGIKEPIGVYLGMKHLPGERKAGMLCLPPENIFINSAKVFPLCVPGERPLPLPLPLWLMTFEFI